MDLPQRRPSVNPMEPHHVIEVNLRANASAFSISPGQLFRNYESHPLPIHCESFYDEAIRKVYINHRLHTTSFERPPIPYESLNLDVRELRIVNLLPTVTRCARRLLIGNIEVFEWRFSVFIQGQFVYWPELIDDLSHPNQPATDDDTLVVISAVKVLCRTNYPDMPFGPGLPPYRPEDLPPYAPVVPMMHQVSSSTESADSFDINRMRVDPVQPRQRAPRPSSPSSSSESSHGQQERELHRLRMEVRRARIPRLHRAAFLYDPAVNYRDVVPVQLADVGQMEGVCAYCRARRFRMESDGFCCAAGKVSVPLPEQPPEYIMQFFSNDRPEHKQFLKNIRAYNLRFAMTSFGHQRAGTGWDPCFRIQGQVYHRIGSFLPPTRDQACFLQIYFLGQEEQLESRSRQQIQGNQDSNQPLRETLRIWQQFLLGSNRLISEFKATFDILGPDDHRVVLRSDRLPAGEHPGCFNAPVNPETAILIVNGETGDRREIMIHKRDGPVIRINEMNLFYDALQYPLIFWRGDRGYTYNFYRMHNPVTGQDFDNKYVSTRAYYCYLLQTRDPASDYLLQCANLLNQFVVDMWAKAESERLRFFRFNQEQLRATEYIHMRDALAGDRDPADVGQRIILPSTFIGGPRNMQEYTQDAMAIRRRYGTPSLFITMTCNPKWDEIRRFIGDRPSIDRYDITSRVFQIKVKQLIALIKKEQIFGAINGFVYSIEWQKRGLPHVHLLVWLVETLRPEQIDDIISAEIPDPVVDPELYTLVTEKMRHGPCGVLNPQSICMQNHPGNIQGPRKCSKDFPKRFTNHTLTNRDGYPLYRRRAPEDGGRTFTIDNGRITLDNRWIVPYCPLLMKLFKTHMNVEFCHSVSAIKYLFKYINKGAAQTVMRTERVNRNVAGGNEANRNDEIEAYHVARYLNASEAFWRFYAFPIHAREPAVLHLEVHLENFQRVYFRPDQAQNVVARITTLTSFFELCSQNPEATRDLLYINVPHDYRYIKNRGFVRRQADHVTQVGRIYTVHPNAGQCFYLRRLLVHRRGPKSFEDIRTVEGHVHESFLDACNALGLNDNDSHCRDAMVEVCQDRMPERCREMFAIILTHAEPADPLSLWLEFRDQLSEDIAYSYAQRGLVGVQHADSIYNECLIRLEDLTMAINGKTFGLGAEQIPLPVTNRDRHNIGNRDISREMGYNREQLLEYHDDRIVLLTDEQRSIYDRIVSTIESGRHALFFIDAPGGTGKTFLTNLILAKIRSEGHIILACASSGIAATLMDGGKTAHSTFSIPIKHRPIPVCSIRRGTNKAELFQQCRAVIWDECTMSKKTRHRGRQQYHERYSS